MNANHVYYAIRLRLGKIIATATQDSKDPSSSELNYLILETETVKAVTGSVTGDAYQMRVGVASCLA